MFQTGGDSLNQGSNRNGWEGIYMRRFPVDLICGGKEKKEFIDQCFSDFNMYMNCLGILLKGKF